MGKLNIKIISKILILLVIMLVVLVTTGCIRGLYPLGWSGATGDENTLFLGSMEGRLAAVDAREGSWMWSDQLPSSGVRAGFGCTAAPSGTAIYGTPVLQDDLVYLGGYNGKVYAFEADSLQKRWVYPVEDNLDAIVGGVTVAMGKVYFGTSGGEIYALDAATGVEAWGPFTTDGKVWATPVISGETLYAASFDKKVYALDAATGEKKWQTPEAGGAITTTPVVDNNVIYFSSFDRYLYAADTADGSLKWQSGTEAGSWFWAEPVIYGSTVYAPCLDGKIYIFDVDNGKELRTPIDLGSQISSSPVIFGDSLIIASQEGLIYSLNMESNQIRPLANVEDRVDAPLYLDDGMVYVHTQEHEALYALNAQTGVEVWNRSLDSDE
ncbi:PQQ-binding-like beta-propeller repeat protein [Chloroflexota bacterium]